MFCWLYRLIISSAVDAGRELSDATRKHIGNCEDCRGFRQMCLSLDEGLRQEASSRADDELPTDFSSRVLAAASARPGETLTHPIRWARPALAAACIAVAALIAVFSLTSGPSEPPIVEPARIDGLYGLMDGGHPAAWTRRVGRPLAGEIQNLTQDTESAVRFLVACVAVDPTSAANKLPN